jgi:hypothetical protein
VSKCVCRFTPRQCNNKIYYLAIKILLFHLAAKSVCESYQGNIEFLSFHTSNDN